MRPRDIGTAAESAVVAYLRENGWPHAERRAMRGGSDAGDITGTPGIVWEVKAGKQTATDADGLLAMWQLQTLTEQVNAHADVHLLVTKRHSYGPARVAQWWAWMTLEQCRSLPHARGKRGFDAGAGHWCRMTLEAAVDLLRTAGNGDPA